MLRGMDRERAPATTDVEQALAGAQPQLAADVIQFGDLRGVEVVMRAAEIRARINHPRIQPELVEIVRDVVVKRDRLPVAFLGMARTAQRDRAAFRRRLVRGRQLHEPVVVGERRQPARRTLLERRGQIDGLLHVARDVEIAAQIGLGEALGRAGRKHAAQRPRMIQYDGGGTGNFIRPCRVIPESEAHVTQGALGKQLIEKAAGGGVGGVEGGCG